MIRRHATATAAFAAGAAAGAAACLVGAAAVLALDWHERKVRTIPDPNARFWRERNTQ